MRLFGQMSRRKKMKNEDKGDWCLMDCESGNPYYFASESDAKKHAIKLKLNDFAIAKENL